MGATYSIHLNYLPLNPLMFDNYIRTDMKKTYGWSLIQNVTRCPISRISLKIIYYIHIYIIYIFVKSLYVMFN